MGMTGVFFTVAVAVFALIKHVDAALAGFALSFAVEFSTTTMWGVRTFVALENNMNSMERVVEFSTIETEPETGSRPPAAWPTEGRVEVDNLVVAYAPDLPPVLRGLTFDIRGGERIGVVGGTGAGKSSLTLAMFRLLEARSGEHPHRRPRHSFVDSAPPPLLSHNHPPGPFTVFRYHPVKSRPVGYAQRTTPCTTLFAACAFSRKLGPNRFRYARADQARRRRGRTGSLAACSGTFYPACPRAAPIFHMGNGAFTSARARGRAPSHHAAG